MKDERARAPEQVMAALFEGRERLDQMALLARLEGGGASMYRAWASRERNVKAREALLKAAEREEENSKLLRLMSTPKSECEKCRVALAANAAAVCCAFQCTFCPACGEEYRHVCPNCGGELLPRHTAQARTARAT